MLKIYRDKETDQVHIHKNSKWFLWDEDQQDIISESGYRHPLELSFLEEVTIGEYANWDLPESILECKSCHNTGCVSIQCEQDYCDECVYGIRVKREMDAKAKYGDYDC